MKNVPKVNYVKPLYYISLLTGLVCPVDFRNCRTKWSFLHFIYCCSIIAATISASILSLLGKMSTVYHVLLETTSYMDAMNQLLLIVCNSYSVINQMVNLGPNLNKYFAIIQETDGYLRDTVNTSRKISQFKVRFYSMQLIFLALCVYDSASSITTYGTKVWKVEVFSYYIGYCLLIIMLQIGATASAMKSRFEGLNRKFTALHLRSIQTVERSGDDEALRSLMKTHDLLCDGLELLNSTFGFNVVFLLLEMIITVVLSLNFALTVFTGMQVFPQHEDVPHSVVIPRIIWALWFSILGIDLAWVCHTTSSEAWKTATIAYKHLIYVRSDPADVECRVIRSHLYQIASQMIYLFYPFTASIILLITRLKRNGFSMSPC